MSKIEKATCREHFEAGAHSDDTCESCYTDIADRNFRNGRHSGYREGLEEAQMALEKLVSAAFVAGQDEEARHIRTALRAVLKLKDAKAEIAETRSVA